MTFEDADEEHGEALGETGFWGRRGAGCIVVARSSQRILLPLRSQGVLEPGTWGVWGGAVDQGSTVEASVLKELNEEAGFVGETELLFLIDFVDEDSGFVYSNYLAIVDEEFTPILNWESDQAEWFELEALPSPLHFGVEYILREVPEFHDLVSERVLKSSGFGR